MIVFMSIGLNTYVLSFTQVGIRKDSVRPQKLWSTNCSLLGERPGQQVQANDGGLPLARVGKGDASTQYNGQFLERCFPNVFFSLKDNGENPIVDSLAVVGEWSIVAK